MRARRAHALVPTTPIVLNLAPRGRSTTADLVPPFLKWLFVREKSPHTIKGYGFNLQAWLAFCQRANLTYPDDATVQAVEVFIAWLRQERGVSAGTANHHLHALRMFYRFAIRERQATGNPAAEAFILKTERKLPRYLPIAEQERLLTELAKDHTLVGRRDYALVGLMLFTGLRVSEICALQLAHVDVEAGVLRVIRGKGNKSRELPIIPRLATILRDYLTNVRPALVGRGPGTIQRPHGRDKRWRVTVNRRPAGRFNSLEEAQAWLREHSPAPAAVLSSPHFFVHADPGHRVRKAGQPLGPKSIHALMQLGHVARILGYEFHPHALRHSFASRARENDGDLQDIQEFMGHASIATTMIYAHLTTRKRNAKLEKLLS